MSSARKPRLPGIPGDPLTPPVLTLDLLNKLVALSPLRCTLAAILELLGRHGGLTSGAFPIVSNPRSEDGGGDVAGRGVGGEGFAPVEGRLKVSASREDAGVGPLVGSGDGGEMRAGVESGATDEQLLEFAMQQSKKRWPLLHRWLRLQLQTNPSLSGLEGASGDSLV